MNVIKRVKAPTPKFFKVLRSLGLALLGISGSIIAAPVVLPAVVVSVAGYMAIAGGVISAVSQMTVGIDPSAPSASSRNENEPQQAEIENHQNEDSEINSG